MRNIKTKIIDIFLQGVLSIIVLIIFYRSPYIIEYLKINIFIISILMAIIIYQSILIILNPKNLDNKNWFVRYQIIYSVLIIILLFGRYPLSKRVINQDAYLFNWLKLIFEQPIIFINLIGNIILFIPLGIIVNNYKFKYYIKFLIIIVCSIIIEILQYYFKVGVLDIYDILLYISGSIIGIIIIQVIKWKKKKKIN